MLNGFGRSLGDGIIGLQALTVALARGAVLPDAVLFRLPGLPPVQQELYAAAEFAEVRTLPWADATPALPFAGGAGFMRVLDLRDFAFDPAFRGVAMIDYFLTRLGVDPATVPPGDRRNTWLAARIPVQRRADGGRVALLCPDASMPLRAMPEPVAGAIERWLCRRGWQVRRLVDAPSLAALCTMVAEAGWVIGTDSAPVHLADAYAVPCLAFLPTHRPEWRVRDYPLCRAVRLRAALPEALEFARDAADVAAARQAWFPEGDDFGWLHRVLVDAEPP